MSIPFLLAAKAPRFSGMEVNSSLVQPGARFDAIDDLGNGRLLMGDRVHNPGDIYETMDYGSTWDLLTNLEGQRVTCIISDREGGAFILLANSSVHHMNPSRTFTSVGVASSGGTSRSVRSYGMHLTPTGALLVCDTQLDGGHIWRRPGTGGAFSDIGAFSSASLYRFIPKAAVPYFYGWAGNVFVGNVEGTEWALEAALASSPLYACEAMDDDRLILADEDGIVYLRENSVWRVVGRFNGAADDMAYLGNGVLIYSTYTDQKNVYYSENFGRENSFRNLNPLKTTAGDIYEHIVPMQTPDGVVCAGGTNLGYFVTMKPKRTSI